MAVCLRSSQRAVLRFAAPRALRAPAARQPLSVSTASGSRACPSCSVRSSQPAFSPFRAGYGGLRSYSSVSADPAASPPAVPAPQSDQAPVQAQVPSYDMTFTCKPCKTRSTHRVSKQGYHHGTVLITCPNCKNRHLISDHLKIFKDNPMTIDKFLEENGEAVKRGTLGPDGDIELWSNVTEREGSKYLPEGQGTNTAASKD